MKNRSGHPVDVQHSTATQQSTNAQNQSDVALGQVVADQIGPRRPGTVYDNASGVFEVRAVVTDLSEARRILRRRSAQFAIEVMDLHTGTPHYTGAVWTGSDRVLKAVTV